MDRNGGSMKTREMKDGKRKARTNSPLISFVDLRRRRIPFHHALFLCYLFLWSIGDNFLYLFVIQEELLEKINLTKGRCRMGEKLEDMILLPSAFRAKCLCENFTAILSNHDLALRLFRQAIFDTRLPFQKYFKVP
ncbi:CLUMA_CG019678, isoform A [Clunio marinus]|uniref:CLUMA_CG019678, isoform A n=1 Tax=Clunio marinus TaxID=568069 RepID=A0A1J1J2B3_9DIPT|nr:CLUMA_CG019678, isoform A [Clunio marinus]